MTFGAREVYLLHLMRKEGTVEYGVATLAEAAERLLALDPDRFLKVLALCWVYLAIYEHPPGSPAEVLELCALFGRVGHGQDLSA